MAGRAPFTNLDPATAADLQRKGFEPHEVDRAMEQLLAYIRTSFVPDHYNPFPATGLLAALPASDGVDRISYLPRELLRNIVDRLPVTDAARTTALSSRWRTVWISSQPVLDDSYLRLHDYVWPPTPANSPAITAAVSSILEAHPGPFRRVHLACSHMSAHRAELARWLQLLAAKGVQDLVLVNRPWPCDLLLPHELFTIRAMVRLYLAFWKLPDAARVGRYFHNLRELGLSCVVMEQGFVDRIVAKSPVLETLSIHGVNNGLRIQLVSTTLRSLQIGNSAVEEIALVKAPRLERLIINGCLELAGGGCTMVKIYDAPSLCVLGFLHPEKDEVQIGNCIIKAGLRESATAMLGNVKILALNVRFGVLSEAAMVPMFLKYFPNVKTLHILSRKCNQSSSMLKLKLKMRRIEPSMSSISEIYFRDFRGDEGEVVFLETLFLSGDLLKKVVVVTANRSLTPVLQDDVLLKVHRASDLASSPCRVNVLWGTGLEGGEPWSFHQGVDFTLEDPFSAGSLVQESR